MPGLELDEARGAQLGEGWITGYELTEELRGYGLGAQLLGQAVSHYRALGRHSLLLRPSDENAAGFFGHQGFSSAPSSPKSILQLRL
ncbi:MAG: GNAT family N-acetyltransferase [Oscillospiraceae bacterium]|jgi:probable phosphoglycerate mutase|nr:GNAT family N-acetyltransferase [Oscillospiraceae bacterium]